jgi:magnesium transporter
MEKPEPTSPAKDDAYLKPEWLESMLDALRDLVENEADGFILNIIQDLHPADLAELTRHLSRDERSYLYRLLNPEQASEMLLELNQPLQSEFVEQADRERISEVIEEMESDDATDLIGGLPREVAEQILESIDKEDSAEVRELLEHEEDTAGGIMAKEFVAVSQELTVDQAIQKIRRMTEEIENIYNVFAVDENDQLVGYVPLQKLLLARPGVKVQHIMNEEVIYVNTILDQEEVARIFKKYDLISLPVVDDGKRLVGRITIDDIVDVLEDEASEDAQKIAGITEMDIRDTSPLRVTRSRLPWLVIAFVGEIISGFLMSRFQTSLTEALYIVFFVPLIMAIGGNVGNQSAIVIIRGLATGEIGMLEMGRRMRSELWVALLLGFTLAVGIYVVSGFWFNNFKIGFVIALALVIVVVSAALTGAVLPFILRKFDIDPAVATSPFITTSNDILGLLIYFSMVTAFLHWMG